MRCKSLTIAFTLAFCAENVVAESCAIDVVMQSKLTEVNEKSKAAISLFQTPDIEQEACLPTLSALSGQLGASIPSFSGIARGLATKIRSMACSAVDDAIRQKTENLNASWEAPYGLGGISGGVTTDGSSGVSVSETTATARTLENEILRQVREAERLSIEQDPYYDLYEPEVFPGISDSHVVRDTSSNNEQGIKEKTSNALDNF